MNGDALPECRKTDAVLALHLDGDVGDVRGPEDTGFDFVCVESLHAHLIDCPSCQRQLQRARRLDAVLAANAGRALADEERLLALERRWLDAIEGEVAATAGPPAEPSRSWRRAGIVAAAIAIVLAAAVFALVGGGQPAAAAPPKSPDLPAPAAAPCDPLPVPADQAAPGELLIAADALRHRSARERTAPPPVAASRTSILAALRQRCADERNSPADRVGAAHEFALATRPYGSSGDAACDELVDMLVGLDDRSPAQHVVLAAMWNVARSEPRFVGHVQRRLSRLDSRGMVGVPGLDDLAVLTVAARLGVRAVDAVVVRVLRRHPSLGEPLAAALRSGLRPSGTAGLLLDAWHELAIRVEQGDDEFAPQAWFAGQAAPTFGELADELRTSGSSPRRVRCLLALGFAPDARVLPTLLERIRRGPELEANAAAFALARLPRTALQSAVESAKKDDDAFRLRAALARAGLDEAKPWVAALLLSDAETEALCFGSFRDFTAVAQRFRDHAQLASN